MRRPIPWAGAYAVLASVVAVGFVTAILLVTKSDGLASVPAGTTGQIWIRGAGVIDHCIRAAAGGIGAAGVCIRLRQIVADGVDDALWDLGAAWAVEKDSRIAIYGLRQGRKLRADPV